MKMKLVLDVDKCCACGACAVACMDQNDIDVAHMAPFRRVADFELHGKYLYTSVSCMHCDDAPCIQGCPVGCLRKDPVTNLTVYDNTNCIGCHSCAMACPYGAPSFRPTGAKRPREKVEKCNGCIERIKAGLQPACVHSCPTGALTWRWAEDDEESSLSKLYHSWEGMTPVLT